MFGSQTSADLLGIGISSMTTYGLSSGNPDRILMAPLWLGTVIAALITLHLPFRFSKTHPRCEKQ